jgi:leucyl/phenylalanyl-tRNA--protein transferase
LFPHPGEGDPDGVVAVGADLAPGTLLEAYRSGIFPMPIGDGRLGWWSPDPRGILEPDALRVSRSLRRSTRRLAVTFDEDFTAVVTGCATTPRPGGWITPDFVDAYTHLHRLGWAHSVEVWDDTGGLVGGLYGVAVGGLFAGESMFHRATDASKVALVALVEKFRHGGGTLLDVQWSTPHLETLGATEIPRREYLRRLRIAIESPQVLLEPADDSGGA